MMHCSILQFENLDVPVCKVQLGLQNLNIFSQILFWYSNIYRT